MAHIRLSDGTTWPNPHPKGDADLSWTLTYGQPTRQELLLAASIVRAYRYLITETTEARRRLIIRELRAATPSAEGSE